MQTQQIFQLIAPEVRTWWIDAIFIGGIVLLLLAFVFVRSVVRSMSQARFYVTDQTLRVDAWPYGRSIPLRSLRLDEARSLDLHREGGLRFCGSKNGVSLPPFKAGWFRLCDGQKVFVFLSDWTKVARIPTREGFTVYVSLSDPDGFLTSLRQAAGDANRREP